MSKVTRKQTFCKESPGSGDVITLEHPRLKGLPSKRSRLDRTLATFHDKKSTDKWALFWAACTSHVMYTHLKHVRSISNNASIDSLLNARYIYFMDDRSLHFYQWDNKTSQWHLLRTKWSAESTFFSWANVTPGLLSLFAFFSCAFHLYMVSRYKVLQLTDNDIFMKMYTTTLKYYLSTFQHIEQHDGTCITHFFCFIKITLLSNCIFFPKSITFKFVFE